MRRKLDDSIYVPFSPLPKSSLKIIIDTINDLLESGEIERALKKYNELCYLYNSILSPSQKRDLAFLRLRMSGIFNKPTSSNKDEPSR